MLRSIGAVLAGYIAIGILVVFTDAAMGRLFPDSFNAYRVPPVHLLLISLVLVTAYSVGGGWITARLTELRNPWAHVVGLIAFGEFMGLASLFAFWTQRPHWYAFALLLLYPPAVWLGGRLHLGGHGSLSGRPRSLESL